MKKFLIVIAMFPLGYGAYSQGVQLKVDTTKENLQFWGKKIADLLEAGVEEKNDSFIVRQEVINLLNDTALSNAVYPASYEWPAAVKLMQAMELKQAFWHFINLYKSKPENRDLIISIVMKYDEILPMDKVMLSSFYTYSFADPRACRVKNGKPEIFRPDLMQELLAVTKEIVGNVMYYRKQKQPAKPQ